MANGATLPQCLMLIHKWAALLRVTLEASFVSAQESKTPGFQLLLNICLGTFDRDALVHLVSIGTAHFALRHWMMVRQWERRATFQVTLESSLRRFSWINDRTCAASGFDMQTPGPVAGLAAHIRDLFWSFATFRAGLAHDDFFCLQSRVGSCSEVADDLFVTGCAFL